MRERARRRPPAGPAGFTIMELMVVTAILGLLAAIAMPATEMSDKRKLDMLEIELQDAMDHARNVSYRMGAKHSVVFNVSQQYLAVVNEQVVPVQDPLSRGPYIVRLIFPDQPEGVRLEFAEFGTNLRPVAAFDEKGVLTEGGAVRISVDGESHRWFEVNTATAKLEEVPITLSP